MDGESIHDYYKRFAGIWSTLVDISDWYAIDYFGGGLRDKFLYQNFSTIDEFWDMVEN